MLTSKILSHRRRPVPMAELDPGLRREDWDGGIALVYPAPPGASADGQGTAPVRG
jgi:hypothetical protein